MKCPFTLIVKGVEVPCGKCEICIDNRRRGYNVRLNNAMKEYNNVFFCTLTFRDELIADKKLGFIEPYINREQAIRCFQLFMKRFRKDKHFIFKEEIQFQKLVKYFCVLEKGDLNKRLHWHMLLFTNLSIDENIMKQCILNSWQYGIVDVKIATSGSISYLTKYMFKQDYKMLISRGLGFGLDNIEQYIRGSVNYNGFQYAVPSSVISKLRRDYRDFYDNYFKPNREKNLLKYQSQQEIETKEQAINRYQRYLLDKKSKENKF